MPGPNPNNPRGFFGFVKDYIALAIVFFSFVIFGILIFRGFDYVKEVENFKNVKDIISLFLPVIGTWMGTVLAFYFTRQNFEAASQSFQKTIDKLTGDDKLKAIKAVDVMIPFSEIDTNPFEGDQKWDTTTLKTYIDFLKKKDRNRLVIFNPPPDVAQNVFHLSTINDFLVSKFNSGLAKEEIDKLTLKDLLADPAIQSKLKNSIDFVGTNATLFDVQQRMAASENCSDVFVTATGSKAEPVKGWITNIIVAENLQLSK